MSLEIPYFVSVFFSRQFLLFSLVGGFAAFLHWGSRIIFNWYVDYKIALVLAYAVGLFSALFLNKQYVFPRSTRSVRWEISFFILVNLIAFPFVWFISYDLSEIVFPNLGFNFYPRAVAHGIAISFPIFANFLAHKFITFRGA